ncbi:hypothetical protein BBOV_II005875 [Babesia bovis T2Bo]|uniref:hypothetical protein n=1 Tax=Babesia bovis T2Bo TaxID=484906 RepID=UPI001C35A52A|nr:hypothetical protein BBOV_II005875 [Babesia bovis T2Bo]KAG6440138.1 hypothetical protein BBOV_II005875 [Babesia bovis T2Bo]
MFGSFQFRRLSSGITQPSMKRVSQAIHDLTRDALARRDQLRIEAMTRYAKQFVRKEKNIAAPRPVYEGPRNVRYWITRRRSGMRK